MPEDKYVFSLTVKCDIQIFWGPEFFKKNKNGLYALLNGILSASFMNIYQRIETAIFYKLVNANKRA